MAERVTLFTPEFGDEAEILAGIEQLVETRVCKPGLCVVLDLRHLERLTGVALGYLIALLKRCRSRGAVLKLCGLCPAVRELVDVVRLDRIFDIHEDRHAAISSFLLTGARRRGDDA